MKQSKQQRGGAHRLSRLTDKQAQQIVALHGLVPPSEIASWFGVSTGNVISIHNGKTWRHLARPTLGKQPTLSFWASHGVFYGRGRSRYDPTREPLPTFKEVVPRAPVSKPKRLCAACGVAMQSAGRGYVRKTCSKLCAHDLCVKNRLPETLPEFPTDAVPVPGFPLYAVTGEGVVWSVAQGGLRALKHGFDKDGYWKVSIFRDAHVRYARVHMLILEAFVGPCPPGMVSRHLDGDNQNNTLNNLCWGTLLENAADSLKHGVIPTGSRNHNAKLHEQFIPEIRRRIEAGESLRRIAKDYGVTPGCIHHVRVGRAWRRA